MSNTERKAKLRGEVALLSEAAARKRFLQRVTAKALVRIDSELTWRKQELARMEVLDE